MTGLSAALRAGLPMAEAAPLPRRRPRLIEVPQLGGKFASTLDRPPRPEGIRAFIATVRKDLRAQRTDRRPGA